MAVIASRFDGGLMVYLDLVGLVCMLTVGRLDPAGFVRGPVYGVNQ